MDSVLPQGSYWPVLCHGVAVVLSSLAVTRGVSSIEPVNNVVVPVLLLIVVFCFYWALFLPHASKGIIHFFSPSWGRSHDMTERLKLDFVCLV